MATVYFYPISHGNDVLAFTYIVIVDLFPFSCVLRLGGTLSSEKKKNFFVEQDKQFLVSSNKMIVFSCPQQRQRVVSHSKIV